MAKQNIKTQPKVQVKKQVKQPVKFIHLLLLIAYGFVTVLTPNLLALDSNGPKFLTLSLLNLLSFLFLFSRKDLKTNNEWYYAFFSKGIGIAYTGLMIVSLLSFFKAITMLESVLHFAKIFTTFSAAYLVSVLVIADKRNVLYLCIAMTLLLIFDSFSVFSGIHKYIIGKYASLLDLKTVYSNKNILASSIFVKIPFALWLLVYQKKSIKLLGGLGVFTALLATFYMSTRAFYLGAFAITILLIIFIIIRYKQTHDKIQLRIGGIYLLLLVFAIMIFSGTQKYLYPKAKGVYNASVEERLATISASEVSANSRLTAWKRSWHVLKQEPLLGCGLGNWKLTTLKEENQSSQDFIYQYKAHNDFIEIPTETGIFGGIFFLTIFLFTGFVFIKILWKNSSSEWLPLLFLPVFGLICYSFDAFFNFPQDRPEIQALFALYVGLMIALYSLYKKEERTLAPDENDNKNFIQKTFPFLNKSTNQRINALTNPLITYPLILVFAALLIGTSYMLNENFVSLKLQRIVIEDINRGKLDHPASMFLDGFPPLIVLNTMAEPIAVQKARYLINEKRNDEAIALLKKDNSSPYDTRKEYFIAMAYLNQNNTDSGMVYSKRMYELKPNFFKNVSILSELLLQKGKQNESEAMLDKYLDGSKRNKDAWLFTSSFYNKLGNIKKAASVIDSAAIYFPTDSIVMLQKKTMDNKALVLPYQSLYDAATKAYNEKRYKEAAQLYTELLKKVPEYTDGHNYRAFCYYFTKEFVKSNQDLDVLIAKGDCPSNLYNLRGVNFNNLGNKDEACKYFKIAADMNDKDGINNYGNLCLKKQ